MFSFFKGAVDQEAVAQQMREKFPDEDALTLQRFLVARNYDLDKASSMLIEHNKWRETNLPIDQSLCQSEIEKGLFTHRGFDKEGRPVFLYHGSKYSPDEDDVDRVIKSVILALEEGLATKQDGDGDGDGKPGDGKLITVFYIDGGSKLNMTLIKQFAKTMSDNYPERCFKALIFPGTPLATTLWNMVSWFFDPRTREKVVIVPNKAAGRDVFASLIPEDQLKILFKGWGSGTPWEVPESS